MRHRLEQTPEEFHSGHESSRHGSGHLWHHIFEPQARSDWHEAARRAHGHSHKTTAMLGEFGIDMGEHHAAHHHSYEHAHYRHYEHSWHPQQAHHYSREHHYFGTHHYSESHHYSQAHHHAKAQHYSGAHHWGAHHFSEAQHYPAAHHGHRHYQPERWHHGRSADDAYAGIKSPDPRTLADSVRTVIETANQMGLSRAATRAAVASMLVESKGDPHAKGDHNTSFGLFQLHRGGELTANHLTPQEAFNPATNARTALQYFRHFDGRIHDPGALAAAAQNPRHKYEYARKVDRLLSTADRLIEQS